MVLVWYEIDETGRFVYRRGVIRRMKGWGKDPFVAALSLVEACGPCRFDGWDAQGMPIGKQHPMPLIQIAAVSEEQTGNTTTLFPGMISAAFKKEYKVDSGKTIIYVRGGKGVIKAVTSSPRALEGPRPSFCVLNETHHWLQNNEGVEMARVIRRNLGKARDGAGRSLEITNAHKPGEGSVAEATYTAITERGEVAGVWYDSLEAPEVKDLSDYEEVTNAIKIARGDSYWVDSDRLYQEIQDPETPEYVAKRFYLNQVVLVDIERWLPKGSWTRLEVQDQYVIPAHDRIVIGFDGSFDGDATAMVGVTVDRPVPFVQLLGLWEKPHDDPQWRVPRVEVMNRLRQCAGYYHVMEVAADPKLWVSDLEVLQEEGLPIVEFPQRGHLIIEATQRLYEDIQRGLLEHDGDPNLARHMANAWVKDPLEPRIQKVNQKSTGYVDGAVATVMGLARAKAMALESEYADITFVDDYVEKDEPDSAWGYPPNRGVREPKIITEEDYCIPNQFY
jgi:phage terminase large subunit-like protein